LCASSFLLFFLSCVLSLTLFFASSSNNPYHVVNDVSWVQCRYLIIQRGTSYNYSETAAADAAASSSAATPAPSVKLLKLDPAHPITLNRTSINIPDVADKLKKLEESVISTAEEFNDSDTELMKEPVVEPASTSASGATGGGSGGRMSKLKRAFSGANVGSSTSSSSKGKGKAVDAPPLPSVSAKPVDTFVPCSEERLKLFRLLPPPTNPSRAALAQLQRETKAMMKSQEVQGSTQAGFYFDPVRFPLLPLLRRIIPSPHHLPLPPSSSSSFSSLLSTLLLC
jgi:ubiquitin-conjugating enzyme E2 Q